MITNDRKRVRWLVLGLSQDGAFIDLYKNHSENSLTGDLSDDTTVNPPLFSLVNSFKDVRKIINAENALRILTEIRESMKAHAFIVR